MRPCPCGYTFTTEGGMIKPEAIVLVDCRPDESIWKQTKRWAILCPLCGAEWIPEKGES